MTVFAEKLYGKTGAQISVNDENEELAGSVFVTEYGKRVKIGDLHVRPDYRGHQFGVELLREAELWTKQRGFREIFGKLIPVPGGEKALLDALKNQGYTIDYRTGIARKKI
ncbi:hypothetical protein A2379_04040 [Candidatus Amesbacteria bacterium RIFOXYB1_FULL_47_13]|nr:MAG: hypothetical protein A2379_04040 [Candidatus Amesbacteria bacterium RIFOXYB1_FULL_47_13]